MASDETLLGSVRDPEDDEIEVFADTDGTVSLRWEFGPDMVLGRVARNTLRELLDRAAMPGQTLGPVFPCCVCCEKELEVPCSPPYHLTACANGCNGS